MSSITPPKTKWYQEYFSGLALSYLKAKSHKSALYQTESDRVLFHLNPTQDDKLLDVLCGFGFHAHYIGQKGYSMTGIDSASECIEHAQSLCSDTQHHFICASVEDDVLSKESYDGAYCLGNSLGYLNKVETLRFFRSIRSAMKEGARFVFYTSMVEECLDANLSDQSWDEYDGIFMLQNNDYDEEQKILKTDCTFLNSHDGIREESSIFHYILSLEELAKLLDIAGFMITDLLAYEENRNFTYGDSAVYIVCKAVR